MDSDWANEVELAQELEAALGIPVSTNKSLAFEYQLAEEHKTQQTSEFEKIPKTDQVSKDVEPKNDDKEPVPSTSIDRSSLYSILQTMSPKEQRVRKPRIGQNIAKDKSADTSESPKLRFELPNENKKSIKYDRAKDKLTESPGFNLQLPEPVSPPAPFLAPTGKVQTDFLGKPRFRQVVSYVWPKYDTSNNLSPRGPEDQSNSINSKVELGNACYKKYLKFPEYNPDKLPIYKTLSKGQIQICPPNLCRASGKTPLPNRRNASERKNRHHFVIDSKLRTLKYPHLLDEEEVILLLNLDNNVKRNEKIRAKRINTGVQALEIEEYRLIDNITKHKIKKCPSFTSLSDLKSQKKQSLECINSKQQLMTYDLRSLNQGSRETNKSNKNTQSIAILTEPILERTIETQTDDLDIRDSFKIIIPSKYKREKKSDSVGLSDFQFIRSNESSSSSLHSKKSKLKIVESTETLLTHSDGYQNKSQIDDVLMQICSQSSSLASPREEISNSLTDTEREKLELNDTDLIKLSTQAFTIQNNKESTETIIVPSIIKSDGEIPARSQTIEKLEAPQVSEISNGDRLNTPRPDDRKQVEETRVSYAQVLALAKPTVNRIEDIKQRVITSGKPEASSSESPRQPGVIKPALETPSVKNLKKPHVHFKQDTVERSAERRIKSPRRLDINWRNPSVETQEVKHIEILKREIIPSEQLAIERPSTKARKSSVETQAVKHIEILKREIIPSEQFAIERPSIRAKKPVETEAAKHIKILKRDIIPSEQLTIETPGIKATKTRNAGNISVGSPKVKTPTVNATESRSENVPAGIPKVESPTVNATESRNEENVTAGSPKVDPPRVNAAECRNKVNVTAGGSKVETPTVNATDSRSEAKVTAGGPKVETQTVKSTEIKQADEIHNVKVDQQPFSYAAATARRAAYLKKESTLKIPVPSRKFKHIPEGSFSAKGPICLEFKYNSILDWHNFRESYEYYIQRGMQFKSISRYIIVLIFQNEKDAEEVLRRPCAHGTILPISKASELAKEAAARIYRISESYYQPYY